MGCVDPVTPEFEYREALIFVEGIASTEPGASFVSINESAIEFGVYVVNFSEGATVSFENTDSGQLVTLSEFEGVYRPPSNFAVAPGEAWKLDITLSGGKRLESAPETVLQPVPIRDIEVVYDKELEFREIFGGKFVAGHELKVSFEDPINDENYYYWSYRTYENLDYCERCVGAIFRDGDCILDRNTTGFPYFDYTCESECWRIRYPESIAIFDDKFSNGKVIEHLSIGNLLLYTKENMVVEVQQFALTPAAYEYYKVLNDIVDNNSGLNSPPPAALVGNMSNPDDPEDFVFGRFTAAATSTSAIFVDRTLIPEEPLERKEVRLFEPTLGSPFPPPATITAPCEETKFRTAIRPEMWVD